MTLELEPSELWLGTAEICAITGRCEKQVRRWVRGKRLPTDKPSKRGQPIRVRLDLLIKWAARELPAVANMLPRSEAELKAMLAGAKEVLP